MKLQKLYTKRLLLLLGFSLAGTMAVNAQCPQVASVTANPFRCDSVELTWPAATGATNYIWSVTQSATPPSAGAVNTTTSVKKGGLLPNVTYYAHVKTNCTMTVSTWVTTSFTTPACPAGMCTLPNNILIPSLNATSITATWGSAPGAIGYEYILDTTFSAPTVAGTLTTLNSTMINNLKPKTMYYFHLRTKCGTNNWSAWNSGIPVLTPQGTGSCNAPSSITTGTITDKSIQLSWPAVSGAQGYEYVMNHTMADPAGSGNAITGNSGTVSNLKSDTTYYMHVRTKCGTTNFSAWKTSSAIKTLKTTGITNVSGEAAAIMVYPNPANHTVNIDLTQQPEKNDVVTIHSLDGRTLKTVDPTTKMSVDISDMPKGIYMIKYTGDSRNEVIRFIKE